MRIAGIILVTLVVAAVFVLTGGLDGTSQQPNQSQQPAPTTNGLGNL